MLNRITRRQLIVLLFISFVGLILRLGLVSYVYPYRERYIQADAIGYNDLAINLVTGHGFSMAASAPYLPDNFRTPGYPLTIASIYALFGYHPELVLWLQALMGAFTIFLAYYVAQQVSDQKAGLIAAALFAFSPHSITYTAVLWSDTEYTLVFTLAIIFFIKLLSEPRLKWALAGGMVSGIAVLIHPRALYLPLMFTVLLIGIMLKRRKSLKQVLIYAGIFTLIFNLVLLPWRFRNYLVFGIPNVTSAAGINMLYYGAALTESARTGENQWSIARRYEAEIRAGSPSPLNPARFAELAFGRGLKIILRDPLGYAQVHTIGMAKVFLPGTSQINTLITGENSLNTTQIYALFTTGRNLKSSFFHSLSGLPIFMWSYIGFEILYLCCVYFFSIYALIRKGRSLHWLWLLAITLIYLALVVGPAGAPRFRVVMMPLLSTIAACGFTSIAHISRKMDQL